MGAAALSYVFGVQECFSCSFPSTYYFTELSQLGMVISGNQIKCGKAVTTDVLVKCHPHCMCVVICLAPAEYYVYPRYTLLVLGYFDERNDETRILIDLAPCRREIALVGKRNSLESVARVTIAQLTLFGTWSTASRLMCRYEGLNVACWCFPPFLLKQLQCLLMRPLHNQTGLTHCGTWKCDKIASKGKSKGSNYRNIES
jgi:hypothetical protein